MNIKLNFTSFLFFINILLANIIYLPPFGGFGGGEAFSQLSSRYINMKGSVTLSNDTEVVFYGAIPTNINGQLVGFANGKSGHGGPKTFSGFTDVFPYFYRLDSTGKFISLKSLKIGTGITPYTTFEGVIPSKDSLFFIGETNDGPGFYSDSYNSIIIKTNSAGTVAWANDWGDEGGTEYINDAIACADGGIAFCGYTDIGRLPDGNGGTYMAAKGTVAKYKANGKVKFNKSFQIPMGSEIASIFTSPWYRAMVECPDKGYLLVGYGSPDPTKYQYNDTSYTGLTFTKLDANGNKLWDRALMYDRTKFMSQSFRPTKIVSYPSGGYLVVGSAEIYQWDANGKGFTFDNNGVKKYYNNLNGGMVMKINEVGDVEWMKIAKKYTWAYDPTFLNWDAPWRFNNVLLSSSSPNTLIFSGIHEHSLKNPFRDSVIGYPRNTYFNDEQTVIIKTDLNANLLWSREYGSMVSENDYYGKASDPCYSKVFEEQGGSLLINTMASPIAGEDITVRNAPPTTKGILRLNNKGYLADASCSLTPKLKIVDVDNSFIYFNNVSFEYDPTQESELSNVSTTLRIVPTTTVGVCGVSLIADFSFEINCAVSGASVNFSNSSRGGAIFHWDFGDPLSSSTNTADSANSYHFYNNSGTYTVTITVTDGDSSKSDSYRKEVIVPNMRYVNVHPENTTVCQGTSLNIASTINSGSIKSTGAFNFDYGANNWVGSYTDSTINTIPIDTGITLRFYFKSFDGCVTGDTIVLTVLPKVHMIVTPNITICEGQNITLVASGSSTFLWNPSSSTNDSLTVQTNNSVTYTVSSGQNKICGTDSAIVTLTVVKPIADAGVEQIIYIGTSAQLQANGGTTYLWSPLIGLNSATIFNPVAMPSVTTIYTVTATDVNGCKASDTVTVFVNSACGDLSIPNAFSPNGDGKNDVLLLEGKCVKAFNFKVYDRWGSKVFESTDINISWDGMYKGKLMNVAVFVYSLSVTTISGDLIDKKGNVTLVR